MDCNRYVIGTVGATPEELERLVFQCLRRIRAGLTYDERKRFTIEHIIGEDGITHIVIEEAEDD